VTRSEVGDEEDVINARQQVLADLVETREQAHAGQGAR